MRVREQEIFFSDHSGVGGLAITYWNVRTPCKIVNREAHTLAKSARQHRRGIIHDRRAH
jgi:hypothetical protein